MPSARSQKNFLLYFKEKKKQVIVDIDFFNNFVKVVQATVNNTKLHILFLQCELRLFLWQVTETQLKLVPAKSFWFVIEKSQDGFQA